MSEPWKKRDDDSGKKRLLSRIQRRAYRVSGHLLRICPAQIDTCVCGWPTGTWRRRSVWRRRWRLPLQSRDILWRCTMLHLSRWRRSLVCRLFPLTFNLSNAEISSNIFVNDLVRTFCFIRRPLLWVNCHYGLTTLNASPIETHV